jgi:NADPH:quinone reductase-like Zn-dependent oxidoreductase
VTSPVGMMRAIRASSPDPASLTWENVPVPAPGPGELLIQVRATAITAEELNWPETWPAIPCHDLSGVVAATGAGVTGWRTGDEIYGLVGFDRPGAAAEYVTAPVADLAPKPAAALIDKQQLHPMVSVVFGLADLPEAFRVLRAARAPGKVVVSIDGTAGHQAMQHPASLP